MVEEIDLRDDVFRTDRDDTACSTNTHKVGPDEDNKAGDCDNIRIKLGQSINAE